MSAEPTGGYYRAELIVSAVVAVFVFLLTDSIFLAALFAVAAYSYFESDDEGVTTDDAPEPSLPAPDTQSDVEGPSGEVRKNVPDGMEGFGASYGVYVTSARPVEVELERSDEPLPYRRHAAEVARRLGYGDAPVVRRLHSELPRRVRDEIRWAIRNDLDRRELRLRDADARDLREYCGTCTVDAEPPDSFKYSVDYSPRVVS